MSDRESTLRAMAQAIPEFIDLSDPVAVALALNHKGYLGRDIGDDLPLIIDLARAARGEVVEMSRPKAGARNQIVAIAETVAQL
jgi:hypothetical protein